MARAAIFSALSALSALALSLAAAPAAAQDMAEATESAALSGRWTFEVAPFGSLGVTQHITGEIELTADGEDQWTCEMSVSDYIEEESVTIRTEQVCVAVREGDELRIDAAITRIEPVGYSYVPDNFSLTIESASRMSGVLRAAGGERPRAVFLRGGALLS